MVLVKKELLLAADFSICIGYLWKYELTNTDDPSDLIALCIETKRNYVTRLRSLPPEV